MQLSRWKLRARTSKHIPTHSTMRATVTILNSAMAPSMVVMFSWNNVDMKCLVFQGALVPIPVDYWTCVYYCKNTSTYIYISLKNIYIYIHLCIYVSFAHCMPTQNHTCVPTCVKKRAFKTNLTKPQSPLKLCSLN